MTKTPYEFTWFLKFFFFAASRHLRHLHIYIYIKREALANHEDFEENIAEGSYHAEPYADKEALFDICSKQYCALPQKNLPPG